MKKTRYIHWQQDDVWLGYLEEYPDYWTQGATLPDLKASLADLYRELTGGHIPHVRRAAQLVVAWKARTGEAAAQARLPLDSAWWQPRLVAKS